MNNILLVLPTYNEEKILVQNTEKILEYLKNNLAAYDVKILIADNGSTDQTPSLARQLSQKYDSVSFFHIDMAGRGGALKKAWLENPADIYLYMDIDLAVDLSHLAELISPLINQQSDIVIGSRYQKNSQVKRSFFRALLSRIYNILLRLTLQINFKDAQCGFKAINQEVKQQIIPQLQNKSWFFDTEMLVLAQRKNFTIKEIAVKWIEPRQRTSKVKILSTIYEYLKEIYRFQRSH